jgi:hypothetical protein
MNGHGKNRFRFCELQFDSTRQLIVAPYRNFDHEATFISSGIGCIGICGLGTEQSRCLLCNLHAITPEQRMSQYQIMLIGFERYQAHTDGLSTFADARDILFLDGGSVSSRLLRWRR